MIDYECVGDEAISTLLHDALEDKAEETSRARLPLRLRLLAVD